MEKLPEITIDDFAKVSLRAAKVLECEPLKKSDKLLVLKVDNGFEEKQVLSGIAQSAHKFANDLRILQSFR